MFLTERFYTDLRRKQFKDCTGWFSNSSRLVLWERKSLCQDIAHMLIWHTVIIKLFRQWVNSVLAHNSLTLEAVWVLAESETASLQWITKCPATWKSRKAQHTALIPTTSVTLIHLWYIKTTLGQVWIATNYSYILSIPALCKCVD